MDVIHTQNQLIQTLKGLTHIAFVPTMGNLHEGHIKLIQEASKVSRNIVVSIFINPLQFNSKEDFKNYPRMLLCLPWGISMKATLNSFKKHQKFQEILS